MQGKVNFWSLHGLGPFVVICILHTIPILNRGYFPTLDGPAHLYNAQLIQYLLAGDAELVNQFTQFNPIPVPNWIGHFLLLAFDLVFPAWMAEKLLLLLYLLGLPLAFRYMARQLTTTNTLLIYLVFPFVWSYMFFLGFYNFILGQVLFFLVLGFWIKVHRTLTNKQVIALGALFLLTYFSHLLIFFLLGVCIFLHLLAQVVLITEKRASLLNRIAKLSIASLPAIALAVNYLFQGAEETAYTHYSLSQKWEWIEQIRAIVGLHSDEIVFTNKIYFIILFLLLLALSLLSSRLVKKKKLAATDLTILAATLPIAFSLGYLYLPDSDGQAGYISLRLLHFLFLTLILWLCTQPIPKWMQVLTASATLVSSFFLLNYYNEQYLSKKELASELQELGQFVADNSTVLPVKRHGDWTVDHAHHYALVDKRSVALLNYECDNPFYPLIWKETEIPQNLLGKFHLEQSCLYWKNNRRGRERTIDYVLVVGRESIPNESCVTEGDFMIQDGYEEVAKTTNCALYSIR